MIAIIMLRIGFFPFVRRTVGKRKIERMISELRICATKREIPNRFAKACGTEDTSILTLSFPSLLPIS